MNIFDVLWGTPWWVYVIFIYLLIVGIKSLRPSKISLYILFIVPIVFIAWSLYSKIVYYGLIPHTTSVWLTSAILGTCIGWRLFYKRIQVDKRNKMVYLSGTVYPLIFYMIFFAIKYCIGFIHAVFPDSTSILLLVLADLVSSGLIAGIFVGRLIPIMKQLFNL